MIASTVAACRHAAGSCEHEILVVSDASTDATEQIAADSGARVVQVHCRQIAATRNRGAEQSTGEYLIFVDADTQPNAEVVRAALEALQDGAVGGSAGFRFDRPIPLFGALMERFFLYFCRLMKLAAGCFVFCRREVFEAVGGFDESLFAAEEWALSRAMKRHGRFVILKQRVLTSGRKLRAYSAGELCRLMLSTAWSGFSNRNPLWYDRRDEDAS
jgi:glycosyltransferase involved in cell wall biosynthesis